ncbi:MAG: hypothetical protein UU40_C0002G0002 [Candidatus Uhrbacteria bacterium GW2011_GWD2_41_121]|uniref:Uncharacterized protein n=1 Tax=Candidatus Uhrbacteria bacterium GW2011_GWC1_41_20 TaxID=1618983 RepID=A0A0G0XS94_9BACT|nr:MAG: hypothetical protein UT52_C0002G0002 [Candidatus Uhrbacteria bacterium GW2011_GWE1_39_46]KKR64485.1 MAG: hypothetical protein UU04_C0001G0002 [Candidatus Uhrbacteria bacterium GW2011_GWC2_40_450]KKR90557.1 MAG: hypothetical protein UU40_C0002G0002 [Candidatus Uhrbacteria bacterium GW2011_GWD2_41_121]KKR96468.1 MAG: hypothetical protein UU46_C0002G0004 [Candidatus Uhrbacteria bacterium GW2011_GWD1_41_16]KKR99820.1 MAG: hypothetical protein UU50_C0002G0002 [Candidatus Uhrbacteria bacteriu
MRLNRPGIGKTAKLGGPGPSPMLRRGPRRFGPRPFRPRLWRGRPDQNNVVFQGSRSCSTIFVGVVVISGFIVFALL